MFLAVIAQMASDATQSPAALFAYGPMGIMLGWFLLRFEKMVTEVRGMRHGFRGLESALLLEVSTRPDCPIIVKNYAKKQMAKLDALAEKE